MEKDGNSFSAYQIVSPSQFLHKMSHSRDRNHEDLPSQRSSNADGVKSQKLKPKRNVKENNIDDSSASDSSCKYRFKIKYDGHFKAIKNGTKLKYCLGNQKTLHFDVVDSDFHELQEEIKRKCYRDEREVPLLFFLNKVVTSQTFTQLEDDNSYQVMLVMYKEEKEVTIYVTAKDNGLIHDKQKENSNYEDGANILESLEVNDVEVHYEEDSDYCVSENSYRSLPSIDGDVRYDDSGDEGDICSYDRDNPVIEVGSQFPDVNTFRRALSHYAVTKDFEYSLEKSEPTRVTAKCANQVCRWRIHASVAQDDVTFIVKTLQPTHTCTGVNKRGNKHANESWVADRVVSYLRSEGDIPADILKKRLESKFGIEISYLTVWRGRELAREEIHGKWGDSFSQIGELKEELIRRNPGSIVDLKTELVKRGKGKESRYFQRFFIALSACTNGFLMGCRPYVALDACHLNGKWKGVLAAAIVVDGNSWMFPVAYAVMEVESEYSWEWFLRRLYDAIGMPNGLVISSDMQKGLIEALSIVYPLVEHRECMRHLYKNVKLHYKSKKLKSELWEAARTYSTNQFQKHISEIEATCPAAMAYLTKVHNKLWSKSQFGTIAKCDYITNNIAETFNSWISKEREKPVLDLLDSVRQKIMVRFNEKKRIARNWKGPLVPKVEKHIRTLSRSLVRYVVHRSSDFSAEVQQKDKKWEVNVHDRQCTCREWQVKGIPCVHAVAFLATFKKVKWEEYVDSHFTVAQFKTAYSMAIAPMPSRHEWQKYDLGFKLLPPILKRPAGRPKKKRMKASDEPKKKKSNKCSRCGMFGHHKNTCKNTVPVEHGEESFQVSETTQGSTYKRAGKRVDARARKRACTESLLDPMPEE